MGKIAVFPASGSLGSSIYKHLLDIVDAGQVILISRHPAKIPSKYTQKGAITRRADYDAPGTLNEVFDGVSYLVLISYPSLEIEHRVKVRPSHPHIELIGRDIDLTDIGRSTNTP